MPHPHPTGGSKCHKPRSMSLRTSRSQTYALSETGPRRLRPSSTGAKVEQDRRQQKLLDRSGQVAELARHGQRSQRQARCEYSCRPFTYPGCSVLAAAAETNAPRAMRRDNVVRAHPWTPDMSEIATLAKCGRRSVRDNRREGSRDWRRSRRNAPSLRSTIEPLVTENGLTRGERRRSVVQRRALR
jgi:hypothetical protein